MRPNKLPIAFYWNGTERVVSFPFNIISLSVHDPFQIRSRSVHFESVLIYFCECQHTKDVSASKLAELVRVVSLVSAGRCLNIGSQGVLRPLLQTNDRCTRIPPSSFPPASPLPVPSLPMHPPPALSSICPGPNSHPPPCSQMCSGFLGQDFQRVSFFHPTGF